VKSRFALPVVIALSVEAVLLLGFNTPNAASAAPRPPVITPRDPPPLAEPEPLAQSEDSSGGSPSAPRAPVPAIPEPPAIPNPYAIQEVVPPSNPQNPINVDRVPTGIAGPSVGPGDGPGGILPSTMLDNAPKAKFQQAPTYPYEAARDQRSGEVLVEFSVDEAGRVFNPVVVRSTDRIFEEPTLRAVAQWRFEPGRREGRAVRFRMRVPVQFQPDGS
jgi:periplasmic protein TonB